jgi:hypothetical protein
LRGRKLRRGVYGALEERLTAKAPRRMQYWPNIPSSIGSRKVLPKSTTDEHDIDGLAPAIRFVTKGGRTRSETYSYGRAARSRRV